MFPDRAKIMGRTVHRKEEIEKAVTSTGTYKLVFNHHPTESDQWIAGASGDAEAVQEVCALETNKTKMDEKINMLEKNHEKKILELEEKMCSLMAPGPSIHPSIHPSFLSKLANATPKDQKQMLGDRLFPIIRNISRDDNQATKIINHLLGSENQQLLLMLEDNDYLLKRIKNLKISKM